MPTNRPKGKQVAQAVAHALSGGKVIELAPVNVVSVNQGRYLEGLSMAHLDEGEFGGVYNRSYYFQAVPHNSAKASTLMFGVTSSARRDPLYAKNGVKTRQ